VRKFEEIINEGNSTSISTPTSKKGKTESEETASSTNQTTAIGIQHLLLASQLEESNPLSLLATAAESESNQK
jgi:hypothetical protein